MLYVKSSLVGRAIHSHGTVQAAHMEGIMNKASPCKPAVMEADYQGISGMHKGMPASWQRNRCLPF